MVTLLNIQTLVPADFDTLQHFYADPARCEERSKIAVFIEIIMEYIYVFCHYSKNALLYNVL